MAQEPIMIEIQRILCPIDFSDCSRRALDHAIAIARWYKSAVTVLHVVASTEAAAVGPRPVVFEPILLSPVERNKLLADTKAFAETERAFGVAIDAVVCDGSIASAILEQAVSMKADLLVIGTHGRSGFERFFLGSVAERVLRKAHCPVISVPKQIAAAVPAGPVLYKRILCPVDFSESSLHALQYGISMAQEADSELTILHVVSHELESTADIQYATGMTVGDFLKEREEALRQRLREQVAGASEFCSVDSSITHGKPWREILRIAAERHSDLIVMGVQGRGAADLVLFGSTTQHVVREASCPVLTLRHG
jgi:nucleotide-binding universal stress UspA family protein